MRTIACLMGMIMCVIGMVISEFRSVQLAIYLVGTFYFISKSVPEK